ncbi:MAG: formylglycine-generating enzyme family protein, partial [Candidatus Acidiferrum sp.]
EELAWFDKYFFKTAKPDSEVVKEGSPLEGAFRAKNVARVEGRLGSSVGAKGKSALVPEVVKRGDLEIGRFEITRAQFSESDKAYKFAPGTENYAANGITFDQANNYVSWLTKTTGQTWRIPYENEVSGFYEKKDGENTLDYWAGYTLNPDDAARLQKKAAELGGSAPLLKSVGSFAGQGASDEDLIYDLGGNVAEWVLMRDGKGKVIGGSADCPADPKSNCTPAPEYVGFRVVRGAAKPAPEKQP